MMNDTIDITLIPGCASSRQRAVDALINRSKKGYTSFTEDLPAPAPTVGFVCCEVRDWNGDVVQRLATHYRIAS